MRTTLTLDPDVAAALDRLRARQKLSLKQAVNDALRLGIRALDKPADKGVQYRTRPVQLGGCLIGSLDDVTEALALSEGDDFR